VQVITPVSQQQGTIISTDPIFRASKCAPPTTRPHSRMTILTTWSKCTCSATAPHLFCMWRHTGITFGRVRVRKYCLPLKEGEWWYCTSNWITRSLEGISAFKIMNLLIASCLISSNSWIAVAQVKGKVREGDLRLEFYCISRTRYDENFKQLH